METKLAKIQLASQNNPKAVFNSIYHMIDKELLRECHRRLDGNKAKGIDNISKEAYGENLERNLDTLIQKLKRHSYKPEASLRVYIPKANGKRRPLGISTYEDKLVQYGLKCVLEAVFGPRFLNNMYGFRPNKSCHDAIKDLGKVIEKGKNLLCARRRYKRIFQQSRPRLAYQICRCTYHRPQHHKAD